MTSSTIFSSTRSQQRWANEVEENITIYIDNPPSIFKVPKSIAETNPEAYSPQQIGIGAFHHFRPDLDDMETKKLAVIKTYIGRQDLENFKSIFVDKMRALEPSIRSCYDKYLDLDSDTLACAMAIDGLYLLGNLEDMGVGRVPNDVWMMENQLPVIVLNELGNISEDLFITMFCFCLRDSPLMHTSEDSQTIPKNTSHLLDMMYILVRNTLYPKAEPAEFEPVPPLMSSSFVEVVRVAADLSGAKFLGLIAKLPYDEFSNLFGTLNFSMEDIQVPSASRLHRHAKIQFEILNSGEKVRYDEEKRTLYLPEMTLDSTHSEVVLRNLVAYELALGDKVVSGYVDLMCVLISTDTDVEFLKDKGIIITDMESGEVAKMFNGIHKSGEMVNALREAAQKLNESGEDSGVLEEVTKKMNELYHATFRVRCIRFVKSHLVPSGKSVKLVLGILLVLLLTLQAFCQVYGCSAHWFGNSVISLASI